MTLKELFNNILYQGLESIGRYYSSYRGYVLDTNDELGLGRIKVKIPSVTHNKPHPTWAYPKTQWGGKDYGMQILPSLGEVVWVEFEHGDTRYPIWNFAHRTEGDKPEEFASSQVYGFKSPKGQTIIIDDRDDVEKIIINHGDNAGLVKVIELTEMMNKNEQKINEFLAHYRVHQVVDPISGMAGPLLPSPPAPLDVAQTDQAYIENENVQH